MRCSRGDLDRETSLCRQKHEQHAVQGMHVLPWGCIFMVRMQNTWLCVHVADAAALGFSLGTQHIQRSVIAWRFAHHVTVKVTLSQLLPAQNQCLEHCVAGRVQA